MISFKGYSINGWESEAGSITNIPAGKKKKYMVDFNLTLANISKAEEIDNILKLPISKWGLFLENSIKTGSQIQVQAV